MRLITLALLVLTAAPAGGPLGSADYKVTPDRPVGWRGDWSGRFPGATPPTTWSRRVRGITSALRYQAARPTGGVSSARMPK